jgi:hypothetical protein
MGEDGRVIPLIVFLVLITVFFAATFWYSLRGDSNSGPALGNNRPYPDGIGPMGAGEPRRRVSLFKSICSTCLRRKHLSRPWMRFSIA